MSSETTDVLSADTADLLPADATDVLSADATVLLPANASLPLDQAFPRALDLAEHHPPPEFNRVGTLKIEN